MNILLVNDDGYKSKGILMLAEVLKKYGTVRMVCPSFEQSAMSHRLTIRDGLVLTKFDDNNEYYHLTGSPADCTRFGIGMFPDTDVVFSGINNGSNHGLDTLYSGTLSAALEANIFGRNSFALSTNPNTFDKLDGLLEDAIKHLFEISKDLDKFCLNLNFPMDLDNIKGYKITKAGFFTNPLGFFQKEDGKYYLGDNITNYPNDPLIDAQADLDGFISITPITVDKTDNNLYNLLVNKK